MCVLFLNVDNMNITRTGLLAGFACFARPCYIMYDITYHIIIYYTDYGIICVSVQMYKLYIYKYRVGKLDRLTFVSAVIILFLFYCFQETLSCVLFFRVIITITFKQEARLRSELFIRSHLTRIRTVKYSYGKQHAGVV